jgi:hypothetical protein
LTSTSAAIAAPRAAAGVAAARSGVPATVARSPLLLAFLVAMAAGGGAVATGGGRSRGGDVSSVQSLHRLVLRFVLLAELLKEKVRARTSECMGWELGLDRRLEVAVFRIQAAQQVKDLARLGDGRPTSRRPSARVLSLVQ